MTDYFFGEVPGNPPGTVYASRREAAHAGVHQVLMQGISGNRHVGANSIAISGGYADDEDHGNWILYTGSGGRDSATGHQIANQELSSNDNAALVFSEENALPIRILRGTNGDPAYSPQTGYRYDGLFKVARHWMSVGAHGFKVWRFRLDALGSDESAPWRPDLGPIDEVVKTGVLPEGDEAPARREGVVQRIVRNTRISDGVKSAYQHECQICRVRLDMPVGRYAEGAHIRGLGEPHDGPDQPGNVLCLCPNHHVLLDKGGIYIDDDLVVRDFTGKAIGLLAQAPGHPIELDHIRYHRAAFGFESIVVGAVIVDDLASPRQVSRRAEVQRLPALASGSFLAAKLSLERPRRQPSFVRRLKNSALPCDWEARSRLMSPGRSDRSLD